ncbi:MAG TPA: hypothetical protein VF962_09000 [Gemmatimonadaceae bacterium]
MKPALLVFAVGVVLTISSSGCHDPTSNVGLVELNTQTLVAPTAIAPGATLTVSLNVEVGGCLTFDHIQSHRTASQVDLTVWGRDIRTGITDRAIQCPRFFVEPREYQLHPPFQNPFTVVVDRGRVSPLIAVVYVQ